MTTKTEIPSTGRYQVITTGPRTWYVLETATRELTGVTFRTKTAAAKACVRRNLPFELKQLPLTELQARYGIDI